MSTLQRVVTGKGYVITSSCEISSSGAFGLSPRGAVLARNPAEQRGSNLSNVIPPADTLRRYFGVLRGSSAAQDHERPFLPKPVSAEHQRLLVEAAAMAPSHFNSQPWRFVLIDDEGIIGEIARISGESMRRLIEEGTFWRRYRPYFRFSEREMEERCDGIHIDRLPRALKPFRRQSFSETGQALMDRSGVPKTLAEANRKLVAGSPLLLAVLVDLTEYRPGELSGFYSDFGMGAVVENIWLAITELGMGIQFMSMPMELPKKWEEIKDLLDVPEDLELMAAYRLDYLPEEKRRPTIDGTSKHRKRLSQNVFRNTCTVPETELEKHPVGLATVGKRESARKW